MGGDGRPRIAGLGAASVPLSMPAGVMEKSPHEVLVPELIKHLRWGSADAGPTTASDVFAFGLVTLEVRVNLVTFDNDLSLNGMRLCRFSTGGPRSSTGAFSQGCVQF